MFNLAGLPNDVNGCTPNFARIYNSMPVLEDGLSSGHASDTENNNPNTGNGPAISMLMDQCKIVDGIGVGVDKYIDTAILDSPQTLISTIQSSVSKQQQQQQQLTRNGTSSATGTTTNVGNYGGGLGMVVDILDNGCGGSIDSNMTVTMRKENVIVNTSPIASAQILPSAAAQTQPTTPIQSMRQGTGPAVNSLNVLPAVVTNSQSTSPIAIKNVAGIHLATSGDNMSQISIIMNNKQQQQKSNDIDLDSLYSISKYKFSFFFLSA